MIEYILVTTEFEAKVKRIYITTEKLMSRQSCLSLCHERVKPNSRQKVPRYGVPMSGHSVLCCDSEARHYVTTRPCARDRDAMS